MHYFSILKYFGCQKKEHQVYNGLEHSENLERWASMTSRKKIIQMPLFQAVAHSSGQTPFNDTVPASPKANSQTLSGHLATS
jgi:hypothetical protein